MHLVQLFFVFAFAFAFALVFFFVFVINLKEPVKNYIADFFLNGKSLCPKGLAEWVRLQKENSSALDKDDT